MKFRYINFQDQLENAYCGGYALAALINFLNPSFVPNMPHGKDIYNEIQEIQNHTLNNNRKCFIDKMSTYLHNKDIEGMFSFPSSVALYAKRIGLNPTVYYNEEKLKENFISVIQEIKLADFNIDGLINEEITLIRSSDIQIVDNTNNFFIANSLSLVDEAMHWIAIGDIKETEEKNRYFDPLSKGMPPYEFSGVSITVCPTS